MSSKNQQRVLTFLPLLSQDTLTRTPLVGTPFGVTFQFISLIPRPIQAKISSADKIKNVICFSFCKQATRENILTGQIFYCQTSFLLKFPTILPPAYSSGASSPYGICPIRQIRTPQPIIESPVNTSVTPSITFSSVVILFNSSFISCIPFFF